MQVRRMAALKSAASMVDALATITASMKLWSDMKVEEAHNILKSIKKSEYEDNLKLLEKPEDEIDF